MQNLQIIGTGGTIDKVYYDAHDDYSIGEPMVETILKLYKLSFDYKIESILKKDSLELNDDDRQMIYNKILNSQSEHILITHGTDTMVQTAQILSTIKNKTIVLTGSFLPAKFIESDAIFNIGLAIGAIQSLKNGVYVAISGKVFPYDMVQKNRKLGKFVSIAL